MVEEVPREAVLQLADLGDGVQVVAVADDGSVFRRGRRALRSLVLQDVLGRHVDAWQVDARLGGQGGTEKIIFLSIHLFQTFVSYIVLI